MEEKIKAWLSGVGIQTWMFVLYRPLLKGEEKYPLLFTEPPDIVAGTIRVPLNIVLDSASFHDIIEVMKKLPSNVMRAEFTRYANRYTIRIMYIDY